MKIVYRKSLSVFVALLVAGFVVSAVPAFAVPSLQLDIGGGWYDSVTQTIVTDQEDFTLYAILTEKGQASISDKYYVSVAVYPGVSEPGADLGSFTVDGTSVAVTGDMTYGTAPLDDYLQTQDPGDLPKHGIFPTYFTQLEFTFDPLQQTGTYNTADNPGGPISGTGSYWYAFDFENTSLDGIENLHFDLYSTKIGKKDVTDVDVDLFAPFSHDAQRVPEPSTVLLLGAGLLGLAGFRRKFRV